MVAFVAQTRIDMYQRKVAAIGFQTLNPFGNPEPWSRAAGSPCKWARRARSSMCSTPTCTRRPGTRTRRPSTRSPPSPFATLSCTKCFRNRLQKSIPTQIRQLILYISNSEGYVDGFVGEWTCAKRLEKHCVRFKCPLQEALWFFSWSDEDNLEAVSTTNPHCRTNLRFSDVGFALAASPAGLATT